MSFYDFTILAGGRFSRREHDSATLEPEAVAIFAGWHCRSMHIAFGLV